MKCPICGGWLRTSKGNYKYVESGLDNVMLIGIPIHKCTNKDCGDVMPELKQVEMLHALIAEALINKSTPLMGKEVRFLRKRMDLSSKNLASLLSVNPVTVSRWETGTEKVGIVSDKLVRMLYIQTMQERCNSVMSGTVEEIIRSIKPKDKQKLIKIDMSHKGKAPLGFCATATAQRFFC